MKKILITGCSSGFGYHSAKYLAQKGYHVYATMRNLNGNNAPAAAELRNFAQSHDLALEVLEMDVTSDASVQATAAQLPAVDVLINNAGNGFAGPVEAFTSAQCLAQMDLNIVGPIRVAKAVLPGMRSQKSGLIIQVSSISGRAGIPAMGLYQASKWGLEGLSEAMRYELGPLGIDVVLVEPGPHATSFFRKIVSPSDPETAAAYRHVVDFGNGFVQMALGMFENEHIPTDPDLVAKVFEQLVEAPMGTRPLRTIVGMDFGFQALNDAAEPIRKGCLAAMGIADWDGPMPVKVQVGDTSIRQGETG